MSGPTRVLLFASVVAALVAPLLVGWPSADVWNLPASWAQLTAEQQRLQELNSRNEKVLQRIFVKREITDRVVAGRLTLREAAAEFLALHTSARDMELLRVAHPGCSDEEASRRNVLIFVREALGDRPWTGLVMARLEQEPREGDTESAPRLAEE